jgi:hypothetical protein
MLQRLQSVSVQINTKQIHIITLINLSRNDFIIIFWKNMVLVDYIGIFFYIFDNSECFGVKYVKIYPEMTSQ